jgi:hypothetical protein
VAVSFIGGGNRKKPRLNGFQLTTSVVIGTVCICSYKSNYHTITRTFDPDNVKEENYYEKKVQTVVLNNVININKR